MRLIAHKNHYIERSRDHNRDSSGQRINKLHWVRYPALFHPLLYVTIFVLKKITFMYILIPYAMSQVLKCVHLNNIISSKMYIPPINTYSASRATCYYSVYVSRVFAFIRRHNHN